MRIITTGRLYADIDAYACAVTYTELLNLLGQEARAVITAPLNQSIPPFVRVWPTPLVTQYEPSPDDTYTLVDTSNPDHAALFIDENHIDEVIDHRPGFEQYWHQKIGDRAAIELVGAASTLIVERWQESDYMSMMSQTSARLLMCGILDNTLNFTAEGTTLRDKEAYEALGERAHLPKNWPTRYFAACEQEILADLPCAVTDDAKVFTFPSCPTPLAVGQLTFLGNVDAVVTELPVFKQQLRAMHDDWFMNIISIGSNRSYFVTDQPHVQIWLQNLLGVKFDNTVAVAPRAWLRKEIMSVDMVKATNE